jgi:hypothetical protein
MFKNKILKKTQLKKNTKKQPGSIRVNLSSSWPESWEEDNLIENRLK